MRPTRRSCSVGLLGAAALLLAACGGDSDDSERSPSTGAPVVGDPGPIHVHGLGINPRDGALFVATHTGLLRAGEGERKATRVADRWTRWGSRSSGPIASSVLGIRTAARSCRRSWD